MNMHGNTSRWLDHGAIATILVLLSAVASSFGQKAGQKTFASAGEASSTLYQAIKNNDDQALTATLGSEKDLVSSGNESDDRYERERIAGKYQEMHRLVREPDGTVVLYIGAENWPFPFPLTSRAGKWYFDSDAGKDEIAFRVAGENEATAIAVCRALVSEKNSQVADTDIAQSVRAVVTSNAAHVGPLDGYYFKTLKGHSPSAVAYIAYPAEYRISGVMTFAVTPTGVVYERDLGPNTASQAGSIAKWKPGSGWRVAERLSSEDE